MSGGKRAAAREMAREGSAAAAAPAIGVAQEPALKRSRFSSKEKGDSASQQKRSNQAQTLSTSVPRSLSPAEMDARLALELGAHAAHFDELQRKFYEQDEFIFLPKMMSREFIAELLPYMEQARPFLNRNYIPMHKKGGSVSSHVLRKQSPTFVNLYKSPVLLDFLRRFTDTRGELITCPNDDAHSVALYFYTEAGDHIGYHYDTSFYQGNRYTMLLGLEDQSSCELLCHLYRDNPNKETEIIHTKIAAGDVALFNGDNLYHAVTPLQEGETRVIVTMEFVTDSSMSSVSKAVNQVKDAVTYFGVSSLFQSAAASGSDADCASQGQSFVPGPVLPEGRSRIIAFVNPNSGARMGSSVVGALQTLIGKDYVFDLAADAGPQRGLRLHMFDSSDDRPLRILACGGDGTIRWVLQGLLELQATRTFSPASTRRRQRQLLPQQQHQQQHNQQMNEALTNGSFPALGIIPLGTGNDLSREFGWGKAFEPAKIHGSNYALARRVRLADTAPERRLDLWRVQFDGKNVPTEQIFFNYFNIGFDPQVALGFHGMRNSFPQLFQSRTMNKAWYATHAAKSAVFGSYNLDQCLKLVVDGVSIPLPTGLKTLVLLNFRCYQAGADLWGPDVDSASTSVLDPDSGSGSSEDYVSSRSRLSPPSPLKGPPQFDDGLIEVVGIQGLVQNALIRVDWSNGVRIGRGSDVEIHVMDDSASPAMACDGEPFEASVRSIRVSRLVQVPVLESPQAL